MHPQNVQIGVTNKARFSTRVSLIPYLRHRAVVAAHAPDRGRTTVGVSAWCRAANEAVVYPKRTNTRGEMGYPNRRTRPEYSTWLFYYCCATEHTDKNIR